MYPKGATMKTVLYSSASIVSGGMYRCVDCGRVITVAPNSLLPYCPDEISIPHIHRVWKRIGPSGDRSHESPMDAESRRLGQQLNREDFVAEDSQHDYEELDMLRRNHG